MTKRHFGNPGYSQVKHDPLRPTGELFEVSPISFDDFLDARELGAWVFLGFVAAIPALFVAASVLIYLTLVL